MFPDLEINPDAYNELMSAAFPDAPCTNEGLSIAFATGGSLIDFDYSREKDILSAKTSVSLNLLLHCHTSLKVDHL